MTQLSLRRSIASVLLAASVIGAVACSSSSDGTTSGASDVLSADEQATFGTSTGSLSSHQETATLADSLFDFDPAATPDANAAAVAKNTTTNLAGCGQVQVNGASLTVDFGAPPGCTLAGGAVVSGKVAVAVSKAGATTSLALTLTSVVVNGKTVAGQTTFATSNGSTFTVTSTLMGATKSESANLVVTGAASSFTLNGTSDVTDSGVPSTVTFKDVVHVKGQCYASSGSMTIVKGAVTEVVTFDASTPQTGQVTVLLGKRTSTTTLPPYGSCPSDATARDAGAGRDAGLAR